MPSPAEKVFDIARTDIEEQRNVAAEQERQASILGNIDDAFSLPNGRITLENYGVAQGEALNVLIQKSDDGDGVRGTKKFYISGQLNTEDGRTAAFPMYRVARNVPYSDTMFPLRPAYSIEVADPNVEGGYSALALVTPNNRFPYFGNDGCVPDDEQKNDLASHGSFLNPHAEAMLEEVHSILGLAMDQQQAEAQAMQALQIAS